MTISFPTSLPQRAPPQIQRPLARALVCKGAGAVPPDRRESPSHGRHQSSTDQEQREPRGPYQTSLGAPHSLVPPSPSASVSPSSRRRQGCRGHTDARATRPARGQPPQSPSHTSSGRARLLVSGRARVPAGPEVRGGDEWLPVVLRSPPPRAPIPL